MNPKIKQELISHFQKEPEGISPCCTIQTRKSEIKKSLERKLEMMVSLKPNPIHCNSLVSDTNNLKINLNINSENRGQRSGEIIIPNILLSLKKKNFKIYINKLIFFNFQIISC